MGSSYQMFALRIRLFADSMPLLSQSVDIQTTSLRVSIFVFRFLRKSNVPLQTKTRNR